MGIEAFVPEPPVERFYVGVVGWLTWAREVQFHAIFIRLAMQHLRDELRAIVHPDGPGRSADGRDPRHRLDKPALP